MDLPLAVILGLLGLIVTLGIGWGIYEYNSRKTDRGRWKPPGE